MKQRMPADRRREQVLKIMEGIYVRAGSQADFTASIIAMEANISVVWFNRLVGAEFREMRSKLPGPRRNRGIVISRLKSEIMSLRTEVKELKAKLKTTVVEEIADAVKLIEHLDGENRALRTEVKMLRKRLTESRIVIAPALSHNSDYIIIRHHSHQGMPGEEQ